MQRFEVKFASEELDAAKGTFAGYGAVFGNLDSHGDVIAPGAFKETLQAWSARGRLPPMKLMHGAAGNPFTGDDLPVGIWTRMEEDSRGLRVEGKISAMDSDTGKRVYGLMQDGALDGLSIGYRPVKFTKGTGAMGQPKRTLEAVSLAEVSIVSEPSNDRARVLAMKSARDLTIREIEEALASGMLPRLSTREAKALLSGGYRALVAERDAGDDEANALRDRFRALRPTA